MYILPHCGMDKGLLLLLVHLPENEHEFLSIYLTYLVTKESH